MRSLSRELYNYEQPIFRVEASNATSRNIIQRVIGGTTRKLPFTIHTFAVQSGYDVQRRPELLGLHRHLPSELCIQHDNHAR